MDPWLLTLLLLAAPPEPQRLDHWTYQTAARPLSDQYADPGGRLQDGQAGRASAVIWQGGTITLEIDLKESYRLSTIRIHQHRHNLNYKLEHLAVLVQRGGQWTEVARAPGFIGPTPTMDFLHELDLAGAESDRLRLEFAGAGVLSLSEIEILGSRVAAAAPAGAYAEVPFKPLAAPEARLEDLDRDGQPEVVLENAHVRMIFAPAQGGVCRSLRLKPSGTELVGGRGTGYGLLRDQFWQPKYSFADRFYFHRLEQGAGAASVELWASGVGGMMSFTEVRKKITLGRDSAQAAVHYTITNEPSSQTDYEYGFWSHNWLGTPGVNRYFFPTTDGVQTLALDPAQPPKEADHWFRDPARGWTAVVGDSGEGLAILVPYRYLNLFYAWAGTGALAATHEWRLNLLPIRSGGKLEFDVTLIPFHGLPSVTGVVETLLGSLEARAEGNAVTADAIVVGGPESATLSLRWSLVGSDGKSVPTDAPPLRLDAAGRGKSSYSWPGLAPGAYDVRLEAQRNGKVVGSFQRPVAVGDARAVWRIEPEAERVGRREESRPASYWSISEEVRTPHIPWARGLRGGPLKALVLLDELNTREAVELAQRIDLQLDHTKFRTTLDKELLYQGDTNIITLETAQRRLNEKLASVRYDVILLSGFKWSFHFSAENRQRILDQVRAGTGLVVIQPDGFDAAAVKDLPNMGVAKEGSAGRSMWGFHSWQPAAEHRLTSGLDWSRFPVTRRHEYSTAPAGEVVATIGKDEAPLLILGRLGQGRTVAATWDVLTHDLSYRGYSGLTPSISYRGGWLRPEFAELPPDHQETWYALLTRLVAWAGQRESGVAVEAPPVRWRLGDGGERTVPLILRGAGERPAVQVEAFVDGARVPRLRHLSQRLALTAAGDTRKLAVPLDELPAGRNTLHYILREPDGAPLAWGFTTIEVEAPATLAKVAIEPEVLLPEGGVWQADGAVETRAFRPDQPLRLTLALAAPAPKALRARLNLVDSRGNPLAAPECVVAAGATSAVVEVPPPLLVHQGLELTVALLDGETTLDLARARATAYRPRVWNRFWFTSWGGNWLWRSEYLDDAVSRLVSDYGIDVSFWGPVEQGTGKVAANAYWDINHSWLGLLTAAPATFGDKDYARKAAEYARTRDKAQLVREPSLADPEYRAKAAAQLTDLASKTIERGGAYDYCMGDEMSLTHYTAFHDFDWSPASLVGFRAWLKPRYADLSALNGAWGTTFTSWDEVLPLTREEAQKAANPAPWVAFRMYMNDQLADFYRFVEETLRKVDPEARAGLSGTQSPEAANGMEWWRLSRAFSYYHSYNTSWSNEMRRSFQRDGGADQSPYYAGYSATNPEAENRLWWCLLHDTRGISAWKTDLFFNGDLSLTPSGRDTLAHLKLFRAGLWRLLRDAERQHDGVAIYYSMPSIIAAALTGEEQRLNAARDAWVKLIEDLGLQYEFVAADQVAARGLDPKRFKVVVLPHEPALSDAEVTALRRFVEAGGTILATRPVGERDELCRRRPNGPLNDLFGVKVSGEAQPLGAEITLTKAVGDLPVGTVVRQPVALANLALADGTALATAGEGRVPVFAQGPSGRALLVNLDLSNFEAERTFRSPAERQVKSLLSAVLAQAGVAPPYPISLASGKASQVEVVRYRAPGVEYVGLLNAGKEPDVATIALGGEKQVYDLRAGASRGRVASLTVPLEPLCARLFALTESVAPEPRLAVAPQAGALTVTLERAGETPLRQLLRLSVTDPSGADRPELMQTVWLRGQPVRTVVPLLASRTSGTWRLIATDVISGQGTTSAVAVE